MGTKIKVIFTADDFGLSQSINEGIVEGHTSGLLTSASLLVNAPATDHAVRLSRGLDLEVGIHLGIVEGYAMSGPHTTVADTYRYFDGNSCLHRNWKRFCTKFALRQISLEDLEKELDLQFRAFRRFFPSIPFANSTQHLHLLPGVFNIVAKLCKKYDVKALRIPYRRIDEMVPFGLRTIEGFVLRRLGRRALRRAREAGLAIPDYVIGFECSGDMTLTRLRSILLSLPPGSTEIMMHPGLEDLEFRRRWPWICSNFKWENELEALKSKDLAQILDQKNMDVIRFADLTT